MRVWSSRLGSALCAVAVLVAAAPAQSAPPSSDVVYTPPYTGVAQTVEQVMCQPGVDACTTTGTASTTGDYSTEVVYDRPSERPVSEVESVYGASVQRFQYKVPPGASKVTAVFTWQVESSEVTASASEGHLLAQTHVTGFYYCGTGCVREYETASHRVSEMSSQDGVPGPPRVFLPLGTPVEVAVTAVGDRLPRHLTLRASANGYVRGGPSSLLCNRPQTCLRNDKHAGQGNAKIKAKLLKVRVTAA